MKTLENKPQISSATVRQATIKDFPRLMVLLFDYLAEFEHKPDLTEEVKERVRRTVFTALARALVVVLVAEKTKHGKPYMIGFAVFDLRPDIFGELIGWGHQLYIVPEFRRGPVMAMLLGAAEKLAVEAGVKEAYIDTPIPKLFRKRFGYKDLYQVVVKRLEAPHVE
jgi:GNAT superfamily N-acetyltransferase